MSRTESRQEKLARVARELGAEMRRQASGRWSAVRMADRALRNRHVWRFRTAGGHPDRYLHLSNRSLTDGEDPTATLLAQLDAAGWLDRMQAGPETSFRLASGGRLQARPSK